MKRFLPICLLCLAAIAQHHVPTRPQEKPVSLLPGLGIWSHPIATRSPEAQKYFDQGLVLLYGFNRYEALRSFRKASELDPAAAMPYWGAAMALGPYINMDGDPSVILKDSCEEVTKGLRVSALSDTDRAWLESAGARCPDVANPARYIQAMRDLAARFPDDPDAQTLYAEALMVPVRWRWYDANGAPAEGEPEAERVLQSVLRRFPDHPGANHLYIHAVESSPTPERGVPSAQRLMGIVPAAGHMVHMPGHIWLALGDFKNAVAVNERAIEVDRDYFEKTGVMGTYFPYYLHNIQFILYARAMQARAAEAREAARQLNDGARVILPIAPEMADIIHIFVRMMQLRTLSWDAVLEEASPDPANALAAAFWRHARAVAMAHKGRLDQAREEREAFESLRPKLDPAMPWGGANRLGALLDLASAELAARLEQSPARAVPLWGVLSKFRICSLMTSRRPGITLFGNRWELRCSAPAMPGKPRRCFAKGCAVVRITAGCCSVFSGVSRPKIRVRRGSGSGNNSTQHGEERISV